SNRYCYDIGQAKDGSVWAAYNRSICHYKDEFSEPEVYLEDKASFLALEVAKDGMVWCGGYNSGLFRLNPAKGKVDYIPSLNGAGVKSSVYEILEDKQGNIWVGGHNIPLISFSQNDGKMPSLADMKHYDITRVEDIVQLNDTCIAVGAVNGFFLVNTNTDEVTHLLAENDAFGWKGTNFVSCLSAKDSHTLYIGTDGAGLLEYDIEKNKLTSYSSASHNFPSNYIRSIEQDRDSVLWISTENKGIFSFDIKEGKVKHRLSSSSLQTDEFFMHSSVKISNGDILFGGKYGVAQILTSSLKDVAPQIQILLSEIGIGQENRISYKTHPEILQEPLMEVKKITLPYGERSLRLRFSTDDLYHQNDHLLVYRLDDEKSDWETMNASRELSFYSLSPGKHSLYVRCIMSNGQSVEKKFVIDALPAPWFQWPAQILYIILLILFVFVIIILHKKQIDNNVAEEKISFFSHVAHDIRTPLSLVSAPISDLEQYISPNAPKNLLPVIKHNLQHLSDVVNQLSLFNSNHQNIQKLNLKAIPLCQFVRIYTEAYQPLAKHQNLYIEVEIPEQEVWILADEQALVRICDNVFGNAFKFTKEGGVKVIVRSRGKFGQIEVQDTGIGMSDATRKKLFRHFFRGDNAIDENVSGFGLGMMYCNQAVRKLGGKMTCQSQEGKGSSFTISLPLTEPGNSQNSSIEKFIQVKESTKLDTRLLYSGYRQDILLVEDNIEMQTYMASKLSVGYNVHLVTNVADAKEYLKSHSADLIISDVMMQGMRGDEWCKELKNNFETAHIPIILLTANSEYEDQLQGLSMGADDYITKPFDINILLMKVRNIFESRRNLHAYYVQTLDVKPKEKTAQKKDRTKDKNNTQRDLDDQFLSQLMKVIDKYISNPDLSVDDLAKEMAMSHTLFYEKINKLLGIPPANLVRNCRMKRAKELLTSGEHSVSDVALMCGFSDAKYFSTAFKKYFGCSPSNILEQSSE
ncbi:MAG: response regulator, partial [Bacteroidales bacterium]|nr:response regulator [Bacteroidales bacterium]